jgi:hypothetical protein
MHPRLSICSFSLDNNSKAKGRPISIHPGFPVSLNFRKLCRKFTVQKNFTMLQLPSVCVCTICFTPSLRNNPFKLSCISSQATQSIIPHLPYFHTSNLHFQPLKSSLFSHCFPSCSRTYPTPANTCIRHRIHPGLLFCPTQTCSV